MGPGNSLSSLRLLCTLRSLGEFEKRHRPAFLSLDPSVKPKPNTQNVDLGECQGQVQKFRTF